MITKHKGKYVQPQVVKLDAPLRCLRSTVYVFDEIDPLYYDLLEAKELADGG